MNEAKGPFVEGVDAAQDAIENGVPRWLLTQDGPFEQMIHPETGLPIAWLSGPPNLAERQELFAKGFNQAILAAVRSGGIEVDFRPLLMSRDDIEHALGACGLGILSPDNPKIQSPNREFTIKLRPEKRKSPSKARIWVCYDHLTWGRWPDFELYGGPIRFALGRDGRVLISETQQNYLTYDVATTQVLNRFLRR